MKETIRNMKEKVECRKLFWKLFTSWNLSPTSSPSCFFFHSAKIHLSIQTILSSPCYQCFPSNSSLFLPVSDLLLITGRDVDLLKGQTVERKDRRSMGQCWFQTKPSQMTAIMANVPAFLIPWR